MHHTHYSGIIRTRAQYIILTFLTIGAIVGFVYLFQTSHALTSKASENTVSMRIKLQGESLPQTTIRTSVILYSPQGRIREYNDVIFTYQLDKTFDGSLTFEPDFNYNLLYALYIKPQKYFAKLFCSETKDGKNCTIPQFIFRRSGSSVSLVDTLFNGGDIDPANGRVDAYDISKIISNLGTSTDSSTDINNDGITNTLDYVLALYSLGHNISDDAITLILIPNPSPTITLIPSPTRIPTPTPLFPFPTNTPTPRCSYCTTAACGQCSNYASGWRCICSGYNGSTYSSCMGILDGTCGVAQPTPTPR